MSVFTSFDLLLPKAEFLNKWPVVACDQFTSQPEYWAELDKQIADAKADMAREKAKMHDHRDHHEK